MKRDDNRTLPVALLAVLVVLVFVPVLLMPRMRGGGLMLGGMMGGWNGSGMTWGTGAGMLVVWLLVLAGLVALGAGVVRRPPMGGGSGAAQDDALAILKQRHARGELSQEQYAQMKPDLTPD